MILWRLCSGKSANQTVASIHTMQTHPRIGEGPLGASDGGRTRDTQDHNLVLYQLSYARRALAMYQALRR
jgi:hypothetical protein